MVEHLYPIKRWPKEERPRERLLQQGSQHLTEAELLGILLGKGTVRIKVLPGALRVIAPEVGRGAEKPPQATGADLPAPVAPVVVEADSRKNGESQPESLPHVA